FLHGAPEGVAVEAKRVRTPECLVQIDQLLDRWPELERAGKERDRLFELVPRQRELTRPLEPLHGARPKLTKTLFVSPGKVRVLGVRGLSVMMREQRGCFVADRPLEPLCEPRVQRRASRLGQALVG